MSIEKKKYVTNEQKLALTDFIEANPKLMKCKFDSQFTFKDSLKLWEDVATTLNGMAGAKKNSKEWKKCWNDLRRNTKEKASKMKKHMNGTGGGPILNEDFSALQEKVVNLIGPTAIEGHNNVCESNVSITLEEESRIWVPDNLTSEVPFEFNDNKMELNLTVSDESSKKDVESIRTPTADPIQKVPRKIQAAARLEKSANVVEGLRSVAERKLEIKQSYYERKLILLERQVEAVERQSSIQEEALRLLKIHFGVENSD